MPSVVIHISNEDPVVGEISELPDPKDQIVFVKNPRRRDGKDLHYLQANVTQVIWPVSRIAFIEVLPSGEEEQIIGFVRD
jgi:hypothetical protein